jgi:hypothetical protein
LKHIVNYVWEFLKARTYFIPHIRFVYVIIIHTVDNVEITNDSLLHRCKNIGPAMRGEEFFSSPP